MNQIGFVQDLDDNPAGNVVTLAETGRYFYCDCSVNVFVKGVYDKKHVYLCPSCLAMYEFTGKGADV